nr:hypothetical protein Itr_chr09CG13900 [Ipomoea trifida]
MPTLLKSKESARKLTEELKSAQKDALKEFRELKAFHEEAMTHGDLHAQTIVDRNASVDTFGDENPMDDAYLNLSANRDSVARMDRDPVLTLTEDGQGDAVTMEEGDPFAAFQLNR